MRSLVNHWSPLTHATHFMTTSRPAAATQMRLTVSIAMHSKSKSKVCLRQMLFPLQPSLFPGVWTSSECAGLHTLRLGSTTKTKTSYLLLGSTTKTKTSDLLLYFKVSKVNINVTQSGKVLHFSPNLLELVSGTQQMILHLSIPNHS